MEGSIEGGGFLPSEKLTSGKLSPLQQGYKKPNKKVIPYYLRNKQQPNKKIIPFYLDEDWQAGKTIFRSAQVYVWGSQFKAMKAEFSDSQLNSRKTQSIEEAKKNQVFMTRSKSKKPTQSKALERNDPI